MIKVQMPNMIGCRSKGGMVCSVGELPDSAGSCQANHSIASEDLRMTMFDIRAATISSVFISIAQ